MNKKYNVGSSNFKIWTYLYDTFGIKGLTLQV